MPTLTVLVIARDEASVIGRCLASVAGLWDELIVIDTGSSDDTCEIAKTHGAKIARFQWVKDFAAARNFAESLATSDYILWIDADEVLAEGHDVIRQVMAEGVVSVRPAIKLRLPPDGELGRPYLRQDLLHKRGSHEWKGAIHEWTEGPLGKATPQIMYEEQERPEGDKPHSWDALRDAAMERTDRSLFYLGSAHGALGHHVEAIAMYDYMLSLDGPPNTMRARAAWMKGHILRSLEDYAGATRAYLDAIYQCPELAEPYYYLGEMFFERGKLPLAFAWFSAAMPFVQQDFSYDLDVYTHLREQKLREVMEALGAAVPVPV